MNEKKWKVMPQMFQDEPPREVFKKATRISDLKNLGPASEREFLRAGIKTAQQFRVLGWKKTMVKLIKANKKNHHTVFAYALIGALSNTQWNLISEAEKQEAKKFCHNLKKKK